MSLTIVNALTWEELKHMLIKEYCPREKMKQLEKELCNLTMSNANISTYTNRFNDITTLCPNLVTSEYKKVERYTWGLVQHIQDLVMASRPSTYDSPKRLAYGLTK